MRIAHFGTFDVENYGDLLLPLIARRRLAQADAELVPLSPVGGPPPWEDCLPSEPLAEAERAQLDGALLGGGNIIHAGYAKVRAYQSTGLTTALTYARLWIGAAEASARAGRALCWNAPGVPEALPRRAAAVLRSAADGAAYLSVRDRFSETRLRDAGVSGPITVVPDTALDVHRLWSAKELDEAARELFTRRGRPIPERTVAFHLNSRYLSEPADSIAARLDRIGEALEAVPVLLALGPCHDDARLALEIGKRMGTEALVVDQPTSLREVVAAIGGAEAYIGSSLHGLITAVAFGRRAMIVAIEAPERKGKFSGFLRPFGLEDWLVKDWGEGERQLEALIATPLAQFSRVTEAASPLLDAHWDRIATLLSAAAAKPRTRRAPAPQLSVEPLIEETVEQLMSRQEEEFRATRAKVEHGLKEIEGLADRTAKSRSWRSAQAVLRAARLLTFRKPRTDGAPARIIELARVLRDVNAENGRQRPERPAATPSATESEEPTTPSPPLLEVPSPTREVATAAVLHAQLRR